MYVEPRATGRGLGCLKSFRKPHLIVNKGSRSVVFFFFFCFCDTLKNVGDSSLGSLPDPPPLSLSYH